MKGRRGGRTLITLTEVSERTKISMPTLQRYKKDYADRIPSLGEGRRQRYPPEALQVFREIKEENLERRGRPGRGNGKAESRAEPGQNASGSGGELLTLTEIERLTGISYPTLLRYVARYGDQIPLVGSGRKRRYRPAAVAVFKRLRAESPRGRRPRGTISAREQKLMEKVEALEKAQSSMAKQLKELEKRLSKPLRVTISPR